jgi:prepilin-type N-terminal cleavage/methylation domain-containing protein
MEIDRPKTDARQHRQERGFSLLEMMIVCALVLIVGGYSFMTLIPMLRQQRVNNAYNTTLAALRQARDNAIAQRTSYSVTFASSSTSNTITVAPTFTGFQGAQSSVTYRLPTDVGFNAVSGIPTGSSNTPDSFGTGSTAIDFGYKASGSGAGGATTLYFCPDGSSQDSTGGAGQCLGNWSGGVVYVARAGDILSSRAVTLWGGTGRVRGWRLYPNGSGGYLWKRQ